jgi:class I lanthipeptide synthase
MAGIALNDPQLNTISTDAMKALTERVPPRWDVEGPSLCHGFAGVLASARTTPATARWAADAVTDAFDTRQPFGFRHLHHGTLTDDPGLLTGAAGIALALADHAGLPTPETATRWDAILLLS